MERFLITTLLSSCLLLSNSAVAQQQAIPPTLLQRIRQLFGLIQPVSPGGSRSFSSKICLISPWINKNMTKSEVDISNSDAPKQKNNFVAEVATPYPEIYTAEPLGHLRLEKDGDVLWKIDASSTTAVNARTPWPIAPMLPNETVDLVLRARGASAADELRVQLIALPKEKMKNNQSLLKSLSSEHNKWPSAIGNAFLDDDQALAMTLLIHKVNSKDHDAEAFESIFSSICKAD